MAIVDKIKKADGKNKKGGIRSFREGTVRFDIQSIIMAVLTTLTIITTIIMGLLIYNRFKISAEETSVSGAEDIIDSVVDKIDGDLLEIRQISNVANYNIVQQYDVSDQMLNKEFRTKYKVWHYMILPESLLPLNL